MYLSGSFQKPFVMEGHGFLMTRYPTSPRTGFPSSLKTSTSTPKLGVPTVQGLRGESGHGEAVSPISSVPPVMLIIGSLDRPTFSKNQVHDSGSQGSPVEPRNLRLVRSCP